MQGFSLSRIGINLAISIIWIDLAGQNNSAGARPSRAMNIRCLLQYGFVAFCSAEILVTVLFLDPSTTTATILLVPAILFACESVVASYFVWSASKMLFSLGSSVKSSEPVKRASRLILISGLNSLFNIGLLAAMTSQPFLMFMIYNEPLPKFFFAALIGCRLLDALIQVLILKPTTVHACPKPLRYIAKKSTSAFTGIFRGTA
jgi:hypothetical protein